MDRRGIGVNRKESRLKFLKKPSIIKMLKNKEERFLSEGGKYGRTISWYGNWNI
jgi:hypothetical protein